MNIEDNSQSPVVGFLKHQEVEQSQINASGGKEVDTSPKGDKGVDKIDLRAELVRRSNTSLKGPENFRADKVADIQSRINAGTYQVSSRDVAEKLIAFCKKIK